MRSPLVIGLVWVASAVLAFLLGATVGTGSRGVEHRAAAERGDVGAEADRTANVPRRAAGDAGTAAERARGTSSTTAAAKPEEDDEPYTMEGVDTMEEASRRFMKFAKEKLAEGPEGHKELFKELDRLMQDREFQALFRDERDAAKLLYPWIKFLMDRDQQVVAMMETIYKTAAEEPEFFEDLDDNSFELFTEGLAFMLPGFVGEQQLGRFSTYAEQILAHDQATLPKALQKNLRDVRKDLEVWSPPIDPVEAIRQLMDPGVSISAKIALLRRVDPEVVQGIDLAAILAAGIESGDSRVLSVMRSLPLSEGDIVAIDRAFVEATANGKMDWYRVRNYLDQTRRTKWEQARPFVENGLNRGDKATEAFAMSLTWLAEAPPKAFVEGVLERYELSNNARTMLRQRFKIE